MFGVVKKLLFARQLQLEEGRFDLLGIKMLLMPAEILVNMQTELTNILGYEKAKKIIYNSIKQASIKYNRMISEKYGFQFLKFKEWQENLIELAGWGKLEIPKADWKTGKAMIIVRNSVVAEIVGHSKKPVDHILAGFFAGGISANFKKNVEAKEIECVACGNRFCKFIIE